MKLEPEESAGDVELLLSSKENRKSGLDALE